MATVKMTEVSNQRSRKRIVGAVELSIEVFTAPVSVTFRIRYEIA